MTYDRFGKAPEQTKFKIKENRSKGSEKTRYYTEEEVKRWVRKIYLLTQRVKRLWGKHAAQQRHFISNELNVL